jgi:hypothetical protein
MNRAYRMFEHAVGQSEHELLGGASNIRAM